jgi:fatty acid desaturase
VAAALLTGGLLLVLQSSVVAIVAGICLIGLISAHALELQHEALHGLAFRSRRLNEIVGVCLGVPMLVSFADYQSSHLRHHRDLGTGRNREFFDYGDQYGDEFGDQAPHGNVSRLVTMCVRFLMFNHYRQFAIRVSLAVTGRPVPGESPARSRRVRRDYLVILTMLALVTGLSIAVHKPLVLTAWLLPLALVACPVHALIELPEHYGCQTDTTEVFLNTRTIRTNPLVVWFVNSNNFHVEHHLKPRLPFNELPSLHSEVAAKSAHVSDGYRGILRELLGTMWWRQGGGLAARRRTDDVAA